MTDPRSIFSAAVPNDLPAPKPASAYAPSNIALSKYWGKRDATLNLPLNSSLSISLGTWGTTTNIAPSVEDRCVFNGATLAAEDAAARKIWSFVDLFCGPERPKLSIETNNTIPTAAGLASSASGFAALTLALNDAFEADLPLSILSMLSRFGSGSATRSFWHGFVRWDKGTRNDGTDSFASPLNVLFPGFRIAIVPVDTGPKSHSSRDGMTHTVRTSPLFDAWPERAEADCKLIERAINGHDFTTLGSLAEANAMAMHATMLAARPALCYLKPDTWTTLEKLWDARRQGLQAFATMDAGANVKLIFLSETEKDVRTLFPRATIIDPFENA